MRNKHKALLIFPVTAVGILMLFCSCLMSPAGNTVFSSRDTYRAPIQIGTAEINPSGYFGSVDTLDFFQVTVSPGAIYDVSVSVSANMDLDLVVYKDSAQAVTLCSSMNEKTVTLDESCIVESSGFSLFIGVINNELSAVNYSITVKDVTMGVSVAFFYTMPNQSGCAQMQSDTVVELYDFSGRLLGVADDGNSALPGYTAFSYPLYPGEYYLKIFGTQGDMKTSYNYSVLYSLTTVSQLSSAGKPVCPDAYETVDDTMAGSTSLTQGVTSDHTLHKAIGGTTTADIDWFMVTIP